MNRLSSLSRFLTYKNAWGIVIFGSLASMGVNLWQIDNMATTKRRMNIEKMLRDDGLNESHIKKITDRMGKRW